MLNRDGITKKTFGAPRQILDNVEFQVSVSCIVDTSVADEGETMAKAGSPVFIDLGNVQTPVIPPAAASGNDPAVVANAVLLHDVDVSKGNANGTALIFGFVNFNRLEASVQAKVSAGVNAVGNVTIIKH